jgi:hypothetical protein
MLNQLKNTAYEYAKTPSGKWLNEFDWQNVPVKFKKLKHDVVGCHFLGRITLMEVVDVSLIFDIYIYELRHVWQAKKQPLRYLVGKLFRKLIEDDADREEAKALTWFNSRNK